MTDVPGQAEICAGFTAHSLGFTDGTNAMQSGRPRKPRRQRSHGRQLTDREWAEYSRGWNEALDAYDIDNA
jgi:hypothetical protein